MRALVIALALAAAIPRAARADDDGPKSRDTAFALSLGGTAAALLVFGIATESVANSCSPFSMDPNCYSPLQRTQAIVEVATGTVVVLAPAFGHWYAGEVGAIGLAARLGGAALVGIGMYIYDRAERDQTCSGGACTAQLTGGPILVYVGLGTLVASAAYDIATTRRAVARYNAAHRSIAIAPTAMPHALGLGVGGRF